MKLEYIIKSEDIGKSIKEILKKDLNISSRLLTQLKLEHSIKIDGGIAYVNKTITNENKVIEILLEESRNTNVSIVAEDIFIDIIYEDEYLLVLNKPPNIAVHPSSIHKNNTLANAVKFYYEKTNQSADLHIVNRLDRETSGIVIFAKHRYIQECLKKQMELGDYYKEYIAALAGIIKTNNEFIVDMPIARQSDSIMLREVNTENGESAKTIFKIIDANIDLNYTVVKCRLLTGRTHQIRVHSKYIGYPILSDGLYGIKSELISRQALHAYKVKIIEPITNKTMEFKAEIPKDMLKLLKCTKDYDILK